MSPEQVQPSLWQGSSSADVASYSVLRNGVQVGTVTAPTVSYIGFNSFSGNDLFSCHSSKRCLRQCERFFRSTQCHHNSTKSNDHLQVVSHPYLKARPRRWVPEERNSINKLIDANGNYSFTVQANGAYTITPEQTRFHFFSNKSVRTILSGASVANLDFTASTR